MKLIQISQGNKNHFLEQSSFFIFLLIIILFFTGVTFYCHKMLLQLTKIPINRVQFTKDAKTKTSKHQTKFNLNKLKVDK